MNEGIRHISDKTRNNFYYEALVLNPDAIRLKQLAPYVAS